MNEYLQEAIAYYQKQGAPKDQAAITALLKEIQTAYGGSIPMHIPDAVAQAMDIPVSLLQALIKRIPSLRLENCNCLTICAGPNCRKHTALADYAEKLHKSTCGSFTLHYAPCMRMCGKGPNIQWNGVLYHQADKALLDELILANQKSK